MATAYRLNSDTASISASRCNDGKTVRVTIDEHGGNGFTTTIQIDTADFIRFMLTLQKNWGK